MKQLLIALLCCWSLFAEAQSVAVPANLTFADLRLRFTDGGRRAVQKKVDALRSHTASFQASVNLADAYFPLIDRVLQEEVVPLDFRYLVVQESGLQGEAQSIHDAVGYWQFKRETAQDYGLVMNDAVDERKHLVAATHAAAKYLKRNNAPLHNWLDALLSYNLGSGGVKPYILPTDFDAKEMEISEQTHPYILTLLAHKVAYEPVVGLNAKPPLKFQEFPAPAGLTLATIAQTLQTDPTEMARHNRWLLATTVPTDKIYTMLVPIVDPIQLTAIASQQRNATGGQLLNKPQADPQNADYVRVNGIKALIALPGDTKESLAQRAGLKLRRFLVYNDLLAFDNIVPGQPYFVQKKRDKSDTEYHVAQPGESVASVSQKYGIRARAIASKNRMPRNEELRAGRILWLKHTRPKEVAIEYADGKNAGALAAFERPTKTSSASPAPAVRAPSKRRIDETEPYRGQVAGAARAMEDTIEPTDTTAASPDLVTQPDSTAGAPTDTLSEAVSTSEPAATEAASTPTTPAPTTPRSVYNGQTATQQPEPTTSPVADQPTTPTSEPIATETLPKPTTKPAAPVTPAKAPTTVGAATAPINGGIAATEPVPANGLHVVQAKEGLYAVARRYGLRPADLIAWNSLPPNPSLQIGQQLRVSAPSASMPTKAPAATPVPATSTTPIPNTAPATPAAASTTLRHTVTGGESMYGISKKYGVTIKQIMEWNSKPDFSVRPGEVLVIKSTK